MAANRLLISIPAEFTDLSLPVLPIRSIDTYGTLLSLDMATSLGSSLPATGSVLANQAYTKAATLIGSGDVNSLSPTLSYPAGSTRTLTERTGKGGLHSAFSASVNAQNGDKVLVDLPTLIRQYLVTNQAHAYYVSFWSQITRVSQANIGLTCVSNDNNNYLYNFGLGNGTEQPTGAKQTGLGKTPSSFAATPNGSLGMLRRSLSISAGTGSVALANLRAYAAFNGNILDSSSVSPVYPSVIFYRVYLEDLTVSGRSFAAIDALDNQFFTEQCLTAGGKYYGDTFTAPLA